MKTTTKTAKNLMTGDEIYKFGKIDNVSKQNHIIVVYSGKTKKIYDEQESVTIVESFKTLKSIYEAMKKSDYVVYHPSYTSAVNSALDFAVRNGYTYSDDETSDVIGTGPKKPSAGKTNSLHIALMKDDKPQKKQLHFQVFNRDTDSNTYELNAYIS